MKWFKDALSEIYRPFNMRGLYNQNKLLVLDGGMYETVMQRLDELEQIHIDSKLDLETIQGIREDIEHDKDNLKLIREEHESQKPEADPFHMEEMEIKQRNHRIKIMGHDPFEKEDVEDKVRRLSKPVAKGNLFLKSEDTTLRESEIKNLQKLLKKNRRRSKGKAGAKPRIVAKEFWPSDELIELDIQKVRSNLFEVVEKEALVQALSISRSRAEAARILGVSYRTLTNKIQKYFKKSDITD